MILTYSLIKMFSSVLFFVAFQLVNIVKFCLSTVLWSQSIQSGVPLLVGSPSWIYPSYQWSCRVNSCPIPRLWAPVLQPRACVWRWERSHGLSPGWLVVWEHHRFPENWKIVVKMSFFRGHYITNPNKALFRGNLSKSPCICIVWSPQNG